MNIEQLLSIRFNKKQLLGAQLIHSKELTSLRDWFPVLWEENALSWRYIPNRFIEPFFIDTLQRQPRIESKASTTAIEWLSKIEPAVSPSAFIFHISRCGSTLLTQLLSTMDNCIALSEPPVLDAFFFWHENRLSDDESIERLRQLIFALGQKRSQEETHFIIKFDCWHTRYLPILRKAFPQTPCWFMFRNPDEVLASHHRKRGMQMVPGMIFPSKLEGQEVLQPGDFDGYCAQVLISFFQEAIHYRESLQWLDYQELPNAIWDKFIPKAGIKCDQRQFEVMYQRTQFHSKDTMNRFDSDPADDAVIVDPNLREQLLALYQEVKFLSRQAN